ncbi:MAG: hypothetical protein AAF604_15190 [Acidobacteriota bacterium]
MIGSPDYFICLECESPSYVFEWKNEQLEECFCDVCGNDEVEQFLSPDDYDALSGAE